MSEQAAVTSITAQTTFQGGILIKLLIFSAALAFAPISAYFVSKDYLWNGNATFAAITAIVAANIVLVAFIIVSVMEESRLQSPPAVKDPESKKDR